MRILMLGWEFPPYISGGLGTACRGLTEGLRRLQARTLFVLPRALEAQTGELDLQAHELEALHASNPGKRSPASLELAPVPSDITNPYATGSARSRTADISDPHATEDNPRKRVRSSVRVMGVGAEDGYDGDLVGKIHAYAARCVRLARHELFDVIHAHDWMTFPAAIAISRLSGRPMIAQVHATEFDRSGPSINRSIYEIEREGMQAAAAVIAVSGRTKSMIVERYDVSPDKVRVVYNGVEVDGASGRGGRPAPHDKTVLFLGRVTMQKGPEFFVRAAARVAERMEGVRFIMAGTGDRLAETMRLAQELGLRDRMEFTGFLRGEAVDRAFENADVYVMPSVSEPFGLTALEAARHGVPVILSTSSGVAEVLRRGSLKADYWDVELMARMIRTVLASPDLAGMLRREGAREIRNLSWDAAARACIRTYYDVVSKHVVRRGRVAAAAAA